MRVRELERRYGSDKALGVVWNQHHQYSELPDGSHACRCTDCAYFIVRREGKGRVVGYAEGCNPEAAATGPTRRQMGNDGHDFAIIDDRYIVDPWVKETAGTSARAVLDLLSDVDAPEIRRLYGDPQTWEEVEAIAVPPGIGRITRALGLCDQATRPS